MDFLLSANTEVTPTSVISTDTLSISKSTTGRYPMKPISGATSLFEADFYATTVLGFNQDYQKFESVAIENPEKSLIYFGLDLSNLNSYENLVNVLDDMLIGRLNFKQ